ncbi:hypothetical protein [Salinilacihabitans rarus]|uniref:hypothetical protein n=1 Tax=Salinilacihabitans rarus TaxID=2961596 RepID=UPI0020C91E7F|nr:hypothetical protein [Salinilacihabitans rarus]
MSRDSDPPRTDDRGVATVRDRLAEGPDRREFLRAAAGTGYALGVARLLGVEDVLRADGEVEVVTALVHDEDDPWSVTRRTKSVPARWYAAVSKAFEVNEALADRGLAGYLGSAVVPGDYDRGGARLTVEVSADVNDVREALEEIVGGVALDVEAIDDVGDVEDMENDPKLSEPRYLDAADDGRVPGGVSCETRTSMATLAPALFHPDHGKPFFVTARHAFGDGSDVRGDPITVPLADGDTLDAGEVRFDHPVEDFVAAEATGPYRAAAAIRAGRPVRVRGQLTRWGLADVAARGDHLEKVAARTGHTTGRISGIDAVTCFTDEVCRRGQLRWGEESDLTDGDSGSVSYYPDPEAPDGGVLVASFNNARTWWPGQSYIWGTAAYRLAETYGYHF